MGIRGLSEWVCQPQSRRFSGGSRLANIDDFSNHQNSLSFMAENFNYFETIWIFGKRNLIDIETFYDCYGYYFLSAYEANDKELEKIIRTIREEEGVKELYEGIENLYNAMVMIKRRKEQA